ncbi:uncharacterized protein LOC128145174 [Harpia harpyja]|uniref:uncharacterized protein LOC128145174 n=1 Tax=Harpia harpyja TaxID=202280 RepID=UPI0022B181CC|nr:uncharacterized protein LOC128145174 [Harpia harpyja]
MLVLQQRLKLVYSPCKFHVNGLVILPLEDFWLGNWSPCIWGNSVLISVSSAIVAVSRRAGEACATSRWTFLDAASQSRTRCCTCMAWQLARSAPLRSGFARVKGMRGAVLLAHEFSPLPLQLKNCFASGKAEEHCVNHPAHPPAPEGCSWSTGELNTIPPNWKRGTLSAHVCRNSRLGSLGRRSRSYGGQPSRLAGRGGTLGQDAQGWRQAGTQRRSPPSPDFTQDATVAPLGASTTSPGNLFQCLTTLSVKKCFLMSSLNLPWRSFEPFPRILSLDPREKSSAPPSPRPLLRKLQRATRSSPSLSLLLSKLDKPKVPSHSSEDMPSSPVTSSVAFFWTHPGTFMSF